MDQEALVIYKNPKQEELSTDEISGASEALRNKVKGRRIVFSKDLLDQLSKRGDFPNDAEFISISFESSTSEEPPANSSQEICRKEGQLEEYKDPIPLYQVVPSDVDIENEDIKIRRKNLLEVRAYLEKDFKAADLKWSLFVAACHSYRYQEILVPFPPAYVKENGDKDIDDLIQVIENTPPLPLVLKGIFKPHTCPVSDDTVDLLYWLFITMKTPYLQTVDKYSFKSVLSETRCDMPLLKPDYIFRIVNSSEIEASWQKISHNRTTIYAFHGSKLENFYSILHNGLQQHLSKKSPDGDQFYGRGIYLSKENLMSLKYSPSGYAWGGSKFGSEISCTAVCEFIINEDKYVELDGPTSLEFEADMDISNVYYVLTDGEMVKLRYLLIYRKPCGPNLLGSSVLDWIKSHLLLVFLLGYVILVLIIGLIYNSSAIHDLLER